LVLKGVLIDFGDTLVHFDEEANKRYEKALLSAVRKYEYRRNLNDLTSALSYCYGNSTKGEVKSLREFWSLFLKKMNIPEHSALVKDFEKVRSDHFAKLFWLYDGVFPTLSALQRKYKLALVSNCSIGLEEIIADLGFTSFCNCIILSYKVRVRKPEKRIYLEALECLRLKASECVFVADEISDLEGARAVGLKTILVRQGSHTIHEAKDPNFKPDFECNRISEITKFI
jgi:HAD superfamily hydrolase (TIGR01549 family)